MSPIRFPVRRGLLLSLAFAVTAAAAPIANPDNYSTAEDTPLAVAVPGVLGNDLPNGIAGGMSAVKVTDPARGTLAFQPNGSFSYTPQGNYFGPDSFQYKVVETPGPVTFTLDQPNSVLTVNVQTETYIPGGTTDNQTTTARARGSLTAQITPTQVPFSTAQVRTMNVALAQRVTLTMCVQRIFGGCTGTITARIEPDGLVISMREDQAGPAASVDGAGVFSQTGNLIDATGTVYLQGSGAASLVNLPPQADINSTNIAYDFNNSSITQSGAILTLAVPIDITEVIEEPDYKATIHVFGTVRATAPVPAAGAESPVTTVTLNVTSVDDPPVAVADRYYTRQNHAINIPAAPSQPVSETLVGSASVWKYATGSSAGTSWRGAEYNDASWQGAAGPLGYDLDIPPASTIPARANMAAAASTTNPNYPTAYFRREFTLTNPYDTVQPRVEFQRDDACIIYVNGVEIYRDSTPYAGDPDPPLVASGDIDYATYASATIPEADSLSYKSVAFSRGLLREGRNVIAAEVHQAGATSSDLRFDLRCYRTTGVGGLAANDTDIDGPAMHLVVQRPPLNGRVTLNPDGSFTYLPNPGFPGAGASATDSFVYRHTAGGASFSSTAVLVSMGSAWKYLDTGVAAPQDANITPADWRNAAFNDAAWLSGNGEFGYGDGDEATVIEDDATPNSPTPGSTTRYITTYFRQKFNFAGSTDLLSSLKVRVVRDDGVVIFLNGTRIVKDNIPDNWTHTSVADTSVSGVDESTAVEWLEIPASALRAGENILAAEVHQAAADSSDVSFDMELAAESIVGARVEIIVLNDDLDDDNVSDTWERSFGIDATVPNGAADHDGDGSSNRAEFLAGTDPLSASSRFRAGTLTQPNTGQLQLVFDSVPGHTYQLQRSDALAAWLDSGASFPAHATNPQTTVQFAKPAPASQFYRLRVVNDWQ